MRKKEDESRKFLGKNLSIILDFVLFYSRDDGKSSAVIFYCSALMNESCRICNRENGTKIEF